MLNQLRKSVILTHNVKVDDLSIDVGMLNGNIQESKHEVLKHEVLKPAVTFRYLSGFIENQLGSFRVFVNTGNIFEQSVVAMQIGNVVGTVDVVAENGNFCLDYCDSAFESRRIKIPIDNGVVFVICTKIAEILGEKYACFSLYLNLFIRFCYSLNQQQNPLANIESLEEFEQFYDIYYNFSNARADDIEQEQFVREWSEIMDADDTDADQHNEILYDEVPHNEVPHNEVLQEAMLPDTRMN